MAAWRRLRMCHPVFVQMVYCSRVSFEVVVEDSAAKSPSWTLYMPCAVMTGGLSYSLFYSTC